MTNHLRRQLQRDGDPPLALGLGSVVLGSIGLIVCFMPVLAIPLSLAGLLLGLAGFVMALADGPSSLRFSAAGIVVCSLALSLDLAINYAPSGYLPTTPRQDVPRSWNRVPDRPYVPPPARPGV